MLIQWIQKTTLVDYPSKVACTIFTSGCNLRCPFCHNPETVLPEEIAKNQKDFIPENIFFNFLNKRKWILDWVVICWWEPTLQPNLFEFIKKIKALGFLVKLDTNWRDSTIIQKLIDNSLVDYIAIDIKQSLEKYQQITWKTANEEFIKNLKQSIQILTKSNIDYEFRTTAIKWYHSKKDIEKIWKLIHWSKKHFLQKYRSGKTLDPNFDWKEFTEIELQKLQEIIKPYVEYSGIRF